MFTTGIQHEFFANFLGGLEWSEQRFELLSVDNFVLFLMLLNLTLRNSLSVCIVSTHTDLLVMRAGCCSTRSSSRPLLSSSRLRAMSASWPMTPNASSRFKNMENSLCRCRVVTRIASGIKAVETRSNRVTSAQGITNLTEGGRKKRIKSHWVYELRATSHSL